MPGAAAQRTTRKHTGLSAGGTDQEIPESAGHSRFRLETGFQTPCPASPVSNVLAGPCLRSSSGPSDADWGVSLGPSACTR